MHSDYRNKKKIICRNMTANTAINKWAANSVAQKKILSVQVFI